MSPFASLLHTTRMKYGICQEALADLIGYEQTYISALERGTKGPPTEEFVKKLISKLNLPVDEQNRLQEALAASNRVGAG